MKKLIATTALALILGGPAVAQEATDEAILPQGAEAGAGATGEPEAGTEAETAESEEPMTGGQTEAAEGQTPPADEAEAAGMEDPTAEGAAEAESETLEPAVDVETAEPEVEVETAEPQVEVETAEPKVEVETAEPEVQVEMVGEETSPDEAQDEAQAETQTETGEPELETAGEEMPADEAEATAASGADAAWRGGREALAAPAVELEGFTEAPADELSADSLMGAEVYDTNDESVGSISDVILDESGAVQFAVVDVGGFLGLGARPVAIGFDEMQVLRGEGDELRAYVDVTQETIEAMPEYEAAEE